MSGFPVTFFFIDIAPLPQAHYRRDVPFHRKYASAYSTLVHE